MKANKMKDLSSGYSGVGGGYILGDNTTKFKAPIRSNCFHLYQIWSPNIQITFMKSLIKLTEETLDSWIGSITQSIIEIWKHGLLNTAKQP